MHSSYEVLKAEILHIMKQWCDIEEFSCWQTLFASIQIQWRFIRTLSQAITTLDVNVYFTLYWQQREGKRYSHGINNYCGIGAPAHTKICNCNGIIMLRASSMVATYTDTLFLYVDTSIDIEFPLIRIRHALIHVFKVELFYKYNN